jgi:TonB-linked SusC/RagA family outer membrane protein
MGRRYVLSAIPQCGCAEDEKLCCQQGMVKCTLKMNAMRFNKNIYKKIRFACLLILVALVSWPVSAQDQQKKRVKQLMTVNLTVTDESGTPLPGASVVVGEGITHTTTDANGKVTFQGYPEDAVTITSFRFEKKTAPVIEVVSSPNITLMHAKTYMTSDDEIPLPFTSIKRRTMTGPETKIPGNYFSKFPTTDLRATLSGITSMYDVREADGSPGMSPLEGLQQYSGLSNAFGATDKFHGMPYVMVDDMPAELQEMVIDPSEIESATFMKGILSSVMYGPAATGGVLYLKTKQGVKNERMLHVDIENGISTIDRMPNWVDGATYAILQNEARTESGLPLAYTEDAINGFRKKNSYDLKYPSTDFKSMVFDDTKEFRRVNVSSGGGNDVVQYHSYIGYAGEGDIIALGSKSDYNRITARQTVNVKINEELSAQFSFYGGLSFRRSPNYGYDSDYTSENASSNPVLSLTEFPSILSDIRNIPSVAYPIWAYLDETTDPATPWYGTSSLYGNNIIGNLVDQGYYTDRGRTGASNLTLTYDLGKLLDGLKTTTYFGFNIHNTVRAGKANDYLAYSAQVNPTDTVYRKMSGHSLSKMAEMAKLMDYYFQRYMFYERISYDKSFGESNLQAAATYHQVLSYINGLEEPQRQRSIVGSIMYDFRNKYSLQAVANYSGNSSFAKDYRNILNWALGGSYVVSDHVSDGVLNFLKVRAQGGVAGNETYFPNLYDVDRWSSTSSTSTTTPFGFGPYESTATWFGSAKDANVNRVYLSRTGNPILTFEKRKEINAGFDAILFNNKMTLDVTYYNWLVDGAISQTSYNLPLLAGYQGARPYFNYNQTRYHALGADISFTQRFGQILLTVGGNATTSKGTRVRYDEPQVRYDYLKRTGKISDAIFGLTYLGKFASDQEAQGGDATPLQMYDETLHKGDLKYADLNGDNTVDDLDQSVIGNSSPRLFYGLNVSVRYRNFDLFILGNGRAFYDVVLNNEYYWNGWGDNNYSSFVQDSRYPRLTYYKVNNNFVNSEYWLAKGSYFKVQNIEFAYNIPSSRLKFIGGRNVRIYARGANLFTMSEIKDLDPESLSAGVSAYPLFRTVSGGIKLNF